MKKFTAFKEEMKMCSKCKKEPCCCEKTMKEDHEYEMARTELETAKRAIEGLMSMMKGEGNLPAWVQSKITKGASMLDSAADYMMSAKETGDLEK
jgi:hypothetical protein